MNSDNRKKPSGGMILGGITIALAAFLVGGYGGAQLTATFLLNQHLDKDVRNIQAQLKILRHMQVSEYVQALDLMESQLNHNLILFDPHEPYEGLSEQTQAAIDKTIRDAKTYRESHPRQGKGTADDIMIESLFKRIQ